MKNLKACVGAILLTCVFHAYSYTQKIEVINLSGFDIEVELMQGKNRTYQTIKLQDGECAFKSITYFQDSQQVGIKGHIKGCYLNGVYKDTLYYEEVKSGKVKSTKIDVLSPYGLREENEGSGTYSIIILKGRGGIANVQFTLSPRTISDIDDGLVNELLSTDIKAELFKYI